MVKFFLKIILNIFDFVLARYRNKYLIKIKSILLSVNARLIYVVEDANWAIEWVGKYITINLKKLNLINAEICSYLTARNKIIHFGSINCLFSGNKLINLRKSNSYVLTWFHIVPEDTRTKFIPILNKKVDFIHTSNAITKKKLVELGFDEKKIIIIPIGIDLTTFKRFNSKKREEIKKKYKIPKDKIVIGSFQKDGVGWGEGLEPKLIKGPDILCEVIRRIHNDFDIHVFLSGPARGYVKQKLKESNIPFTHIFFENYLDIVECYNVLDLYLITSRVEGGPQAVLEGMATGVPIVTTKVGMVPEIIKNKFNGFITKIEDVDNLYKRSIEIIENKDLRRSLIENGLKTAKDFDWEIIAKNYFNKIYKKLLEN